MFIGLHWIMLMDCHLMRLASSDLFSFPVDRR